MYQPPHFREERVEVMHDLIRHHPLGLLICNGPEGLVADLVPFLVDAEQNKLLAHVSRANPQPSLLTTIDECLVVFQGPETYITPSWYMAKQETGRVVPTWNYAVVQVYGKPSVIDDPNWLRQQVGALTNHQESVRNNAWQVEDAPEDYIESQLRGIIGIEIEISRMEGKWKVSQNRSLADRDSVAKGLIKANEIAMAQLVQGELS